MIIYCITCIYPDRYLIPMICVMIYRHQIRATPAGIKLIVYSTNINQIMIIVNMVLFTVKRLILKGKYIYERDICLLCTKNPV